MSDLEDADSEKLHLVALYHPNDDFRRTAELELLRRYVEKGDYGLLTLLVNEPLTTTDGLTDGLMRILTDTRLEEYRQETSFGSYTTVLADLLEDNRLPDGARNAVKTVLDKLREQWATEIADKSESTLFEIAVDGTKPESLRIAAGVLMVKKNTTAKKTENLLRMSKNLMLPPQVRQDAEEELIKLKTEEIRGYVEKGDYHSVIRMYQDKGMPQAVNEIAYAGIKTSVDKNVNELVKRGQYSEILNMRLNGELIEMGIQISEDRVKDATLVAIRFAEVNGRYDTIIAISRDDRITPDLRASAKEKIGAAALRALEKESGSRELYNKMGVFGREEIPPGIREQAKTALGKKAQDFTRDYTGLGGKKFKPSTPKDVREYIQKAKRCAKLVA